MKIGIELNGKKPTKKDIIAMSKHPKTVALFEKNKALPDGIDLSILKKNNVKVKKAN